MSRQSVAFVALMSVAVSIVYSQDIVFPGETDRPSRFPLVTPRPTAPLPNTKTTTPEIPLPNVIETTSETPFVPSVTAPSTAAYNNCVLRCPATSEHNPVCGTDGVVYSNPGRLNCAFNCGNPVQFVKYGQCVENIRG